MGYCLEVCKMEGFVEHLGRVRPVGFWGWVRLTVTVLDKVQSARPILLVVVCNAPVLLWHLAFFCLSSNQQCVDLHQSNVLDKILEVGTERYKLHFLVSHAIYWHQNCH